MFSAGTSGKTCGGLISYSRYSAVARVGTLQIEVPDAPGPITLDLSLAGPTLGAEPIERTDRGRIVSR